MTAELAREPFETWPEQRVSENLRAWFVPPRAVVLQYRGPRFDLAAAREAVDYVKEIVGQVGPGQGLAVIHDLRNTSGTDYAAQHHIRGEWRRWRKGDVTAVWLVIEKTPNLLSASVLHTLEVIAAVSTGIQLKFLRHPGPALAELGLS